MIVDYDGIPVEFFNLEEGGIDQRIKSGGCPVSPQEKSVFNHLTKPKDIVFDVGAYIGSHSIFFALKDTFVYAFEPSVRNYNRLVANTSSYPNISCYNIAFHDHEYKCDTLFKDCNTSISKDTIVQPIEYVVIEKYISKMDIGYPNVVKMDIEGMETIVLNTFTVFFEQSRPRIILDAHRHGRKYQVQRYQDNPSWLDPAEGGFDFNKLKEYRYKLYNCDSGGFIQIPPETDYNTVMGFKSFALVPEEFNLND
jgi:FkbM family methyltransferase